MSTSMFLWLWTRAPRTAIQLCGIGVLLRTLWQSPQSPIVTWCCGKPIESAISGRRPIAVVEAFWRVKVPDPLHSSQLTVTKTVSHIKHDAYRQPEREAFPRPIRQADHDEPTCSHGGRSHHPCFAAPARSTPPAPAADRGQTAG